MYEIFVYVLGSLCRQIITLYELSLFEEKMELYMVMEVRYMTSQVVLILIL